MGRRRIEGTQHIRRKPRKGAIIAGISTVAITAITIIGAYIYQGKTSMSKLKGEESIISTSASIEANENMATPSGQGSVGSIITVSPVQTDFGKVVGTGMLEMTDSGIEPDDPKAKYLEITAVPDNSYEYELDHWVIDGEVCALKKDTIRLFYYPGYTQSRYNDLGYRINKSVGVQPIFKERTPSEVQKWTLTAIVSPNIGRLDYYCYDNDAKKEKGPNSTVNGYHQINYDPRDKNENTYKFVMAELNDAEKNQFIDKDNPKYSWYVYSAEGTLKKWGREALGTELFKYVDKTGDPATQYHSYDDGTVLVVHPNLKTGTQDEAVGVAVPEEGGVVTWTGTQLKATANQGYKFDHWEWYENSENRTSKENPLFAKPSGVVVYKAYFVKAQYQVSVSGITPADSCIVTGLDYYDEDSEARITVKPQPGYKFKDATWTTTDGIYHHAQSVSIDNNGVATFTVPHITENIFLTIEMESTKYTIEVKADPSAGAGTVEVKNLTNPTSPGPLTKEEFVIGDKASIKASPMDGYTFKYFKDSKDNIYSGTPDATEKIYSLDFDVLNADGAETYVAYFVKNKINVTVDLTPSDAGTVQFNEEPAVSSKTTYTTDGRSNVRLTATPKANMEFSNWVDQDGKIYTDNPLTIVDISKDATYTAVFVQKNCKIDVQSSPEAGGHVTINGVEGGLEVKYGDDITMEAIANSGYTFKYFKDSRGNEFVSNPLNFKAVNGSETYIAYFVKDEINVTIDLTPSGSGTVRLNDEPAVSSRKLYPVDGRSNVKLTATPKENIEFVHWVDQDGNIYPDNPLTIVDISKDLTFTAVFANDTIGIKAVASPASGGRIKKTVNDDGSITLIATATKGYTFVNWKKGNTVLTNSTKYVVQADDVHDGDVYTAYFKYDPNYDAKSDITKEKFYREWRKVITPNYTVTRDSMKLLAMLSVAGLHQYDDATPGLKNYGAIAKAQAYFDEKVAKDAARLDGIFGDSELMTVEGEILTPDLLPDFIEYEKLAKEFTYKKFGELYDTEILTVKRVMEPEGFNNIDRTYLWRYTGAENKDNIYLIYNVNGQAHEWATPIVDEDGVLKFTIDKLKDKDIVAVVRVKLKK